RYDEADLFVKRWLPASPEVDPNVYRKLSLSLAELRLAEGDALGANEFFARTPANVPYLLYDLYFDRITTALCMRDYDSAIHLVESSPDPIQEGHCDPTPGLKLWFQAQIARAQNGVKIGQSAFASARKDAGLR